MKEDKIVFELKKTANLLKRTLNTKYKNFVTTTQLIILNYIEEKNIKGKKVYAKDLEDFLDIRRSSISEILEGMENKKLIKRNINNVDLRTKEILLDKEGENILLDVKKKINEIELGLYKDINKNDLNVFFNVLKTIRKNLEDIC